MTKLCPRGKAAAKRKFKVYPSAYANAYASKICAGKIKDPSGVKRKDFRGSKAKGGRIGLKTGLLPENSPRTETLRKLGEKKKRDSEIFKKDPFGKFRKRGASREGVRMGPKTFFVGKEDPRKGSFGTGKKDLGKRKPFKTIDKMIQEQTKSPKDPRTNRAAGVKMKESMSPTQRRDEGAAMKRESRLSTKIRGYNERVKRAGGGLMEATARLKRQGLGTGGSVCKIAKRGMNRDAIGKNS